MSESFDIVAATGRYAIQIEVGAFAARLSGWKQNIIIADDYFRASLQTHRNTLLYPASESTKSLDIAPQLIERLRECGANRQTTIVAIGGGIIQDLTAFAASIYMRGVPWIYVPTTILAMADSCIGGKSSINVGPYKNLVGTFHPPENVFIDPRFASTLPIDQQASGIVEAAKICFCRGPESFGTYLRSDPRPGMATDALAQLVTQSLHAKKWFIEIDEFDRKERLLLNFGHTFGHALEGASHYSISHGIAVGLGILCAIAFVRQAKEYGGVDPYHSAPSVAKLEDNLDSLLKTVPKLRQPLASLRIEEVLDRFESDKKHKQDSFVLILVDTNGEVVLQKIAKSPESRDRVKRAIQSVVESYVL
jgi:3-dehydroquinate synthase